MGFWTLHGDVGDIGPIMELLKGLELYDIAAYLGVPDEILKAQPDDGLGVVAGGDKAQLGADYLTIDKIMISLIKKGFKPNGSIKQLQNLPVADGFDPVLVAILAKRCVMSAYKRKANTIPFPTRRTMGLSTIKNIRL